MIVQNWNIRSGEEKLVIRPDQGTKVLVNKDTFTKSFHSTKIMINGYTIPRKMCGNIRCITSHRQVIKAKNLPKYLYINQGKVVGIEY